MDGFDEWEKEAAERAANQNSTPNDVVERRAKLRDSGLDSDQIDRSVRYEFRQPSTKENIAMADNDAATAATQYWLNLSGGSLNNQTELELKQSSAPRVESEDAEAIEPRRSARAHPG